MTEFCQFAIMRPAISKSILIFVSIGVAILAAELLARLPGYELAEEPRWAPSPWARAYRSVPVRLG